MVIESKSETRQSADCQSKVGAVQHPKRHDLPKELIYVGKDRPLTDYVIPVTTILNNGGKEIIVKSRGQCNNNNLSLSQYLVNRVFKGVLRIKSIDVSTEVMKHDGDERLINVTVLTITLVKV